MNRQSPAEDLPGNAATEGAPREATRVRALDLNDIVALYEAHGHRMYEGEPVTQLEHALQCAHLAESHGADAQLVTAALLHDLGHLVNDLGDTPTARGLDDRHECVAGPYLAGLFDDSVLQPIRFHVDAKRFLRRCRPTRCEASRCREGHSGPTKRRPGSPARSPCARCNCACGTISRRRPAGPRRRSPTS
jgi:hypothetical protein